MTPLIVWFCLALIVTFVEMTLVTFYLLAIAAGMCAGGIAAYMDTTLETQITAAAITTIIMACFSFMLRKKLRRTIDSKLNNMDQGERVQVLSDKIAPDGSAKVSYRGTDWVAYSTQGPLTAGIYLIEKVDGARLVLGQQIGDASQVESGAQKADSQKEESTVDLKDQGEQSESQDEKKGDTAVKF